MADAGERPIVLYDRDCGFCRWILAKVLLWDRSGRLRPVALQDPEADELLAGMPQEQRMGSWHFVAPDGELRSAGSAFELLFRELPGGRPLSAAAARIPGAMERGYRLIAGNRTPIGRRIPDSWKQRADRRIAAHGS